MKVIKFHINLEKKNALRMKIKAFKKRKLIVIKNSDSKSQTFKHKSYIIS